MEGRRYPIFISSRPIYRNHVSSFNNRLSLSHPVRPVLGVSQFRQFLHIPPCVQCTLNKLYNVQLPKDTVNVTYCHRVGVLQNIKGRSWQEDGNNGKLLFLSTVEHF